MKDQRMHKGERKGSVIVLTVLFIVFVFIPLLVATVDVGFFYSQRSQLQSVADMAALGSMGNVNFYDLDNDVDIDSGTEEIDIKERVWKIFENAGITEDKLVGADKDSKLVMTFKTETRSGISNIIGVDVQGTGLVDTFFYSIIDPSKAQIEIAFRSKCYIKYKWNNSVQWIDYNGLGMYGLAGITYAGGSLAGSYDSLDTATFGTDPTADNNLPVFDTVPNAGDILGGCNDNLLVGTGGDFVVNGAVAELNGDLYASGTAESIGVTGDVIEGWDVDDVPPAVSPDDIPMPQIPTANHNSDYAMLNGVVGLNVAGSLMADGTEINVGPPDDLVFARGGSYVLDGARFSGVGSINIVDALPGGTPIPADEVDEGGWTNIYVKGDFSMSGQEWSGAKVRLIMVTPGTTFKASGQANWYCDIIAPGSSVELTGQGVVAGRIMAADIDLAGLGKFYYDEQIGAQTLPSVSGEKPSLDIPPRLVQTIPDPE